MKNYTLREDEIVLFKCKVKVKSLNDKCDEVELLLTNLNIVFLGNANKEVHDVKSIKVYNSTYQVIRKSNNVEIYMLKTEKCIEFPSVKLAKEFTDTSLRLVSGYSKFVRGVKKAQRVVEETNQALNIDIGKAIKNTATVVGSVAIEVSGLSTVGKKTKLLGNIAKGIIHSKPNAKPEQKNKEK